MAETNWGEWYKKLPQDQKQRLNVAIDAWLDYIQSLEGTQELTSAEVTEVDS
jgi:hypothetical protein